MAFINLTPHSIEVYREDAFINLTQVNPTTWNAEGLKEGVSPILSLPSMGNARITVSTVEANPIDGIPIVESTYGELTGVPDDVGPSGILIVSLPCLSMAKQSGSPLALSMVSPYKVVRSFSNGSLVLGCMGFTR
jgi:hypothetical protein